MTNALPRRLTRRQIAWRAAQDIPTGACVNLGIGLPTLVADYVDSDREVIFHSENGILGMGRAPRPGEEDADLINAGKQLTTLRRGGSFVHHNDAFVMIRGGHIDLALMGAFEISMTGDLANWTNESSGIAPGVGGAMDLAVGAKEVRVLIEHTTKDARPRLVARCTLPLTARACVRRVYTDLAVLQLVENQFVVCELVADLDFGTLESLTGAPLVRAPDCRTLSAPPLTS